MKTPIAIVGGGIAGLAAAWRLQQLGQPYTLFEAGDGWGGKIITTHTTLASGATLHIDGGPELFITRKPEVWQLAHELGLQSEIITPKSETSGLYVFHNGQPHAIPTNPLSFLTTQLLTTKGKLRLLVEPFIPIRQDDEDESLLEFASRRLGHEAAERIIGPILGGIYNTDPALQSVLISAPLMRELERDYGGLFRGAFQRIRAQRRTSKAHRPPAFIALKNGSDTLVKALVSQLTGQLRSLAPIHALQKTAAGYVLGLADERTPPYQAVIFATPAPITAKILLASAPQAAHLLNQIPHTNLGTLTLAFHAVDIPPQMLKLRAMMIPRRENRAIDAFTWTTSRIPDRAPQGIALLRVFFGGAQPELTTLPESDLVEVVLNELNALVGLTVRPIYYQAFRWTADYPQARVGHHKRIAEIEAALPPAVFLAGSAYRGVGVPDCIQQGYLAAQQAAQTNEGRLQTNEHRH